MVRFHKNLTIILSANPRQTRKPENNILKFGKIGFVSDMPIRRQENILYLW